MFRRSSPETSRRLKMQEHSSRFNLFKNNFFPKNIDGRDGGVFCDALKKMHELTIDETKQRSAVK